MKSPEANKSFRAKSQVRNMWLALCLAGAGLAAASLAGGTRGPGAATLLVCSILMAVWTRRASLVRLFDDHLEMKFAPLAPLRSVLYRDIRKVETVSKNKALLTYHDGRKERCCKIPLNMLAAADADVLLRTLQARAA